MDFKLENKRVLVLGSSSGLGFAIAKSFAEEGALVGITSREMYRAEAAAEKIPGSMAFMCDFMEPNAGKQIVQTVLKPLAFGRIDILVTNIGAPSSAFFSEVKGEDWDAGYHRFWKGTIDAIHTVLPSMREKKWGRIIMCTSTTSKEPISNLIISNAYQGGLIRLMKTISLEVAPDQVTINAIMPGYIKTKKLDNVKDFKETIADSIPANRLGEPEEFAALATFLGSEQAGYINGQTIGCDGGLIREL